MPGFGVLGYLCRGVSTSQSSYNPNEPGMMDFISSEDLLEAIFEHLDIVSLSRCARTCRAFANTRWPTANLGQLPQRPSARQLEYILAKRPHVLVLPCGFEIDEAAAEVLQRFSGSDLTLKFALRPHGSAVHPFLGPKLHRLSRLDLSGSLKAHDSVRHLAEKLSEMPLLEHLLLEDNGLDAADVDILFEAQEDLSLLTLSLSDNDLGDIGATTLAPHLRKMQTLRHLGLDNVGMTSTGLKTVIEACPHVATLKMSDNAVDAAITKPLASVMQSSLRRLELKSTDIDANDLMLAIETLKGDRCVLEVLRLWDNRIADTGASAIARSLKENKSLKILDLRFNCITNRGARSLASALEKNKTLHTLSLKFNRVRDSGCKHLSNAFAQNTTLRTLDLEDNDITDDGATALARGLAQHPSLRELNLRYNSISDAALPDIGKCLETNGSLVTLDLSAKPHRTGEITGDGLMVLERALLINTSIRRINVHNHAASESERRRSRAHTAPGAPISSSSSPSTSQSGPDRRHRSRSTPVPPPQSVISTRPVRAGSVVRRPRRTIFFFW